MHRQPNVMNWLRAGVPLTLLIDLLDRGGPDSASILASERPGPASAPWLAAILGHVAAQLDLPAADLAPRD